MLNVRRLSLLFLSINYKKALINCRFAISNRLQKLNFLRHITYTQMLSECQIFKTCQPSWLTNIPNSDVLNLFNNTLMQMLVQVVHLTTAIHNNVPPIPTTYRKRWFVNATIAGDVNKVRCQNGKIFRHVGHYILLIHLADCIVINAYMYLYLKDYSSLSKFAIQGQ